MHSFKVLLVLLTLTTISFFSIDSHAEEDCLSCHEGMGLLAKPVVHDAPKMGCSICHASMETDTGRPNHLIDSVNNLCMQCHDKADVKHGHPVSGPKDPLYPNLEFNCASCHSAHSTSMEFLFRYKYGAGTPYTKGGPCSVCHWDMVFGGPKPPTPPRVEE